VVRLTYVYNKICSYWQVIPRMCWGRDNRSREAFNMKNSVISDAYHESSIGRDFYPSSVFFECWSDCKLVDWICVKIKGGVTFHVGYSVYRVNFLSLQYKARFILHRQSWCPRLLPLRCLATAALKIWIGQSLWNSVNFHWISETLTDSSLRRGRKTNHFTNLRLT